MASDDLVRRLRLTSPNEGPGHEAADTIERLEHLLETERITSENRRKDVLRLERELAKAGKVSERVAELASTIEKYGCGNEKWFRRQLADVFAKKGEPS